MHVTSMDGHSGCPTSLFSKLCLLRVGNILFASINNRSVLLVSEGAMGTNSIQYTLPKLSQVDDEDEAFAYAMYLRTSATLVNVLNAALELGLLDIIARAGPGAQLSPSEVVSHLPTNNPQATSLVDRMFRLLTCHSLLSCTLKTLEDGSVTRVYGLTLAGRVFTNREDGRTMASFKFQKAMEVVWFDLKDLVLEGGDLFEKVHGLTIYDYMSQNPDMSSNFNKAMGDLSKITMTKVLDAYKGFEGLTSLVDVGGGVGTTLKIILSKYPSIQGINLDEPHVILNAPPFPGITHVGGDMFKSVPNGNAIIMKNILHNWGDEDCIKILRNCYDALPKNGKVIVLSWILTEEPESSIASKYVSHMDIIMCMHPGGRQRTESEFRALSKAAGFSHFQVDCYAYHVGIMELHK
ncbi:Methyltransf_2 domain-containing protein/Dimerisation domain-containing protein [Cephalotus follicularis]|uniref:Methyltransf_2 domain-containing protein/Dimerisation domain-containing protein n=1 Tax=Cephalotus follicularis TaxID=3775 RepID=A0A1Q3CG44_CEPFO|nr:Methyltransf_2 domain-containing protein/Dimerisation domain-containing protein [Cephalotus follicularis]